MTMRHGDEEDMGHLLGNMPAPEPGTIEAAAAAQAFSDTLAAGDAGPAATARAEEAPTPLEQAIERTSRHQDTPGRPRRTMSAIDRLRAARIAWAAWREASDILGNDRLPLWDALNPQQVDACEALIEEMAGKPFGAATSRQAEIFQAIAYTVGE